jgi:hypothetical protein
MKLLISQKNDILDTIINAGLNPNDFHFKQELQSVDEIIPYLYYKETNYYFSFRYKAGYFHTSYSPGENSLEESTSSGGWKQFLTKVKRWLQFLKREIDTFDRWETFKSELSQIPFSFEYSNIDENFSKDELVILDQKINAIKSRIERLELPIGTIKQINDKLDSLNDKAAKMSKTNWKELFIGGIISVIFNLAIPQGTAEVIWDIIRQSFKHYILP